MASSNLTLHQFQQSCPYLSNQWTSKLRKSGCEPNTFFEQVFSQNGKPFIGGERSKNYRLSIKGIMDNTDRKIKGIFICIHSSYRLDIYTIVPTRDDSIMTKISFDCLPDEQLECRVSFSRYTVSKKSDPTEYERVCNNIFFGTDSSSKSLTSHDKRMISLIKLDTSRLDWFIDAIKPDFAEYKQILPVSLQNFITLLDENSPVSADGSQPESEPDHLNSYLDKMQRLCPELYKELKKDRNNSNTLFMQLFSPEGKSFVGYNANPEAFPVNNNFCDYVGKAGEPYNIRMGWDSQNNVFLIQFHSETVIEAYKIRALERNIHQSPFPVGDHTIEMMLIDDEGVKCTFHILSPSTFRSISHRCCAKDSEVPIKNFHSKQFNHYEAQYKGFVGNHLKHMLSFIPEPYHLDDKVLQGEKLELLNDLEIFESRP